MARRCKRVRGYRRCVGRRSGGRRRASGMAKRGSRCTSFKRVRVKGQGYARRCRHYRRR